MKVAVCIRRGRAGRPGDGYAFEIGFTRPERLEDRLHTADGLAEFDGKFRGRTATGNEYWIKCTLTGNASLSGLKIKNDIQMAPLAMPSMTVGDNRFTYLEHTDDRSGANAARHLRITHNWVERSTTRPPQASGISRVSGRRRRERRHGCGVPVERRHRPRRRCHHGLSFPAFGPPRHAVAHVPQLRQIHFQDARPRPTRYTLPRPGLLTHGTTYYWHVKAKDAHGVWGPWSATWSFTAQGPAIP